MHARFPSDCSDDGIDDTRSLLDTPIVLQPAEGCCAGAGERAHSRSWRIAKCSVILSLGLVLMSTWPAARAGVYRVLSGGRHPRPAPAKVATSVQDWVQNGRVCQELRDSEGLCKSSMAGQECTLWRTPANDQAVRVSVFGNSYTGYYCWTNYGLKDVLEDVMGDKATASELSKQELHPRFSFHTYFNAGLRHQKKTFPRILLAEDPDYVFLQDGSLVPMGVKGVTGKHGRETTLQTRNTANALRWSFGSAIWDWASGRNQTNGRKPIVFLIASWARPEEAFAKARHHGSEMAGILKKKKYGFAQRNYEVYRKGVKPSLTSHHYVNVHHEGDMLEATLDGLGVYRECIFKGAAHRAGRTDGPEFRREAPFEVAIAPVGVSFYDIRTKVEDIFKRHHVPDRWWHDLRKSTLTELQSNHEKVPTQAERMQWPGSKERNFLITSIPSHQPWFGHPTPLGTYLYGAVLKRVLLSGIQGKDGRHFGDVKLVPPTGNVRHAKLKRFLIEEVNAFDFQKLDRIWRVRGAKVCDQKPSVCQGGGVPPPPEDEDLRAPYTVESTTTNEMPIPLWPPGPIVVQAPQTAPVAWTTMATTIRPIWSPTPTKKPLTLSDEGGYIWGPGIYPPATVVPIFGQMRQTTSTPRTQPVGLQVCTEDYSDSCMFSRTCCSARSRCYEKDALWAACLPSCAPGVHWAESQKYQSSWSCRVLPPVP